MNSLTNETYVPLSRGILEHLEEMGGTALTIYIYLLCRAKHTGKWKGKVRVPLKELAIDLGIHFITAHKAIKNHLLGKYITMTPAKNQHSLTEFTILKYKTVQDFKPSFNKPAISADTNSTTNSTTNSRETARLTAGKQQIASSLEPQGITDSQECKELKNVKNVKNVKKNKKKQAKKEFSLPSWIPQDAWDGYLEMRKKNKKPPTTFAMELAIRELKKLKEQGHSPEAVLNQSILNGWTGLFPIKTQDRDHERSNQAELAKSRVGAHHPTAEPQKEITLEEYTAKMTELEREMTGDPTAIWEPPEALKNALNSQGAEYNVNHND